MKLIFLDIDGVLNSLRSCMAHKGYPHPIEPYRFEKFDMTAVGLVKALVEKTEAKVILSSSWRLISNTADAEAFENHTGIELFDETPALNRKRGYEIQVILERYQPTHYAILDDSSDMLESQMNNFVKVDYENGLSYENYRRALGLLGHEQGDIIIVEED